MSDYDASGGLPLFDCATEKPSGSEARKYYERAAAQMEVLHLLRSRARLTKQFWESIHPGSRIAPTVEILRNAYGFSIGGDGSVKLPYFMEDPYEYPSRCIVTKDIKEAYYASAHWKRVRAERWAMDGWRCVQCKTADIHTAHHMFYDLFNEQMRHLITVCKKCHEVNHLQSKLKFPSGMSVENVRRLGLDPNFSEWLFPGGVACR